MSTQIMDFIDPSAFSSASIEYFASSSSTTGTSPLTELPGSSSSDDATTTSPPELQTLVKTRRRPIPRKGHTKSRRGCFSCKKRKIKCQETHPKCENCIKAGMTCEYPNRTISTNQKPSGSSEPMMQPQATPTIFTINDMRYFHFFLTRAYPHLPIGADSLWTLDIPQQAHECDFLMHSILGLGASHLALTVPNSNDVKEQALAHRIKAVNGLNEAFTKPITSKYDADARFATLMNLTFQSATITDGLADFMTMLRGCVLQGAICDGLDTSFKAMAWDAHMDIMSARFGSLDMNVIPTDFDSLDRGMASLKALEQHCQPGVETRYLELLMALVRESYVSPGKAYFSLTELYNIVGMLSPEDFKKLTDANNPICQVLLGHFLAVHVITRPISLVEEPNRDASVLFDMLETWVCLIHANLEPSFRKLHEWPLGLIREAASRKPMPAMADWTTMF